MLITDFFNSTSEINENVYLFVFISWLVSFDFVFTYNISLMWWEINSKQQISILELIKRRSNVQEKNNHKNVLEILTNRKHFPKIICQWEFDYGLFTSLPRIIVACDVSPSSFKLKRDILPLLTKEVSNLKTTCHIKLKFFWKISHIYRCDFKWSLPLLKWFGFTFIEWSMRYFFHEIIQVKFD